MMNPAKRFKVLAVDENRMSQILAAENIFGTLFPILKKYTHTITIAQNFVRHCIKTILAGYEQSRISIFVLLINRRVKRQAFVMPPFSKKRLKDKLLMNMSLTLKNASKKIAILSSLKITTQRSTPSNTQVLPADLESFQNSSTPTPSSSQKSRWGSQLAQPNFSNHNLKLSSE